MTFTIITPSFNQAEYIERTIQSVLNQVDVVLEYLIIDGNSTDHTKHIISQYENRIKLISETDTGQSNAINKGLRMATGDIIAFLNSDDVYFPGTLKQVENYFSKNPESRWVYGKCIIIDKQDHEIRKPITWYKNLKLKKFSYRKLLRENYISQPATFWRRETVEEIGLLNEDEHYCMDYDYWLRIGAKYDAGVINVNLAKFRYYSNSKSGNNFKEQFQDELRLAQKYGKQYPFSLLMHRINYYKITWIYHLLKIINK